MILLHSIMSMNFIHDTQAVNHCRKLYQIKKSSLTYYEFDSVILNCNWCPKAMIDYHNSFFGLADTVYTDNFAYSDQCFLSCDLKGWNSLFKAKL